MKAIARGAYKHRPLVIRLNREIDWLEKRITTASLDPCDRFEGALHAYKKVLGWLGSERVQKGRR